MNDLQNSTPTRKSRRKTPNTPNSPYRNAFKLDKKLEIIDLYYNKYGENASETARQVGISQSMVSRWVKDKSIIEAFSGKKMSKIVKNRTCWYPELEDKLYTWIINKRVIDKCAINYDDLKKQARVIVQMSPEPEMYSNFRFSSGWVANFMERHCSRSDFDPDCPLITHG